MAKSHLSPDKFEQRLARVENQQLWMNRVLESYGIRGTWLSPAKAAPLLGVGRDRIVAEVERAEQARVLGQPSDLRYGHDYRNVQDPALSEKPTWQINVTGFDRVLAIPPDERKV
ncbi:MAG: hypothetical protein O2890_04230 [Cyanobacteria bacterium]|nr:hypothetical protein [Cyanobacteriota bacterium]MDA0865615.1 hypothetical protein [Cyanobacteriota bacterium]